MAQTYGSDDLEASLCTEKSLFCKWRSIRLRLGRLFVSGGRIHVEDVGLEHCALSFLRFRILLFSVPW
jgi:hypothetical protein